MFYNQFQSGVAIALNMTEDVYLFKGLPHMDSLPDFRQSPSNISLDRGLTASPIPWRDASMEVLVSPSDGPHISFDDYDDWSLDDSPFLSEPPTDFDTISMCDIGSGKSHGRFHSETSFTSPINGADKIVDRKFACYGVSPRLSRKANDFTNVTPATKGDRPMTLNFSNNFIKDSAKSDSEEPKDDKPK